MNSISVVSFNVRGLRDRKKRRTIFRHMHIKYRNHIVMLQETHSSTDVEGTWQNDWGSTVIYSHGTLQQVGVAILLPRSFPGIVKDRVAAPVVDMQEVKFAFLEKVHNILADVNDTLIIIGGDFNVHLGPFAVEKDRFKETSAGVNPPGGGGRIRPPRFFRNFFIYYCIDMKLGTPLRASIWRRLVQRKSKSAGNF